jgi:hypothetical protein
MSEALGLAALVAMGGVVLVVLVLFPRLVAAGRTRDSAAAGTEAAA